MRAHRSDRTARLQCRNTASYTTQFVVSSLFYSVQLPHCVDLPAYIQYTGQSFGVKTPVLLTMILASHMTMTKHVQECIDWTTTKVHNISTLTMALLGGCLNLHIYTGCHTQVFSNNLHTYFSSSVCLTHMGPLCIGLSSNLSSIRGHQQLLQQKSAGQCASNESDRDMSNAQYSRDSLVGP